MIKNIQSPEDKLNIIEEIIKECYWDYNITAEEISGIAASGDMRLKRKLFAKIMYNSKDRLKSLLIFKEDDLKELLDTFSPAYNEDYIARQTALIRNIILGEKNHIKGAAWKKI